MTMRVARSVAVPLALVAILGTGAVTGCSSSSPSKPAVCSSLDSLKTSVQNLTKATPGQNALTEIQNDVAVVRSDAQQVIKDAKSQYSSQTQAIKNDLASMETALDDAKRNPSATSLGAVLTAASALGQSISALSDAVKNTC